MTKFAAVTTPTQNNRWHIAQIGAREHYAPAIAMQRHQRLAGLYTDLWCPRWLTWPLSYAGTFARAIAGRRHPSIPDRLVHTNPSALMPNAIARLQRHHATSVENQYDLHLAIGKRFAKFVANQLTKTPMDPLRDVYFGFNTGCLETLEITNDNHIFSIVDQIDPARVEQDLVLAECERWPDWQDQPGRIPERYYQRLADEWQAASCVVVNSQWSKQALIKQQVPCEKIVVIPLAYKPPDELATPATQKIRDDDTLIVLWLGNVILRKGIPYLIDAARQLKKQNRRIKFLVAGPIGIRQQHIRDAPDNMEFLGRITRDRTTAIYQQAHCYVLPTISDGFAITQLEAMAHGLPVITTPRCGEVVRDQTEGLLVPPADADALAQAIAKLDDERALLKQMSHAAQVRIADFSLEQYAQALINTVERFKSKRN